MWLIEAIERLLLVIRPRLVLIVKDLLYTTIAYELYFARTPWLCNHDVELLTCRVTCYFLVG